MATLFKKKNSRNFFTITTVLFLVNFVFTSSATNFIPADGGKIESWFQSVIKPLSLRKGTLEPSLVEAENAVEIIKVRKDGSGKFKTITDAVKSIDIGNNNRVIISIGPGEYKEKIKIERFKPYITFYGTDPKNMPIISYSGTAAQYGTVDSATLIVESDYFVGVNLVIANSAPRPDGKRVGAQAVALRISGDSAAFYNCKFKGFQDTICDDKGDHFFKDCYIEGTVDFIFGEARSIYLNSEIRVIPGDPLAYIVAHARKNADGVGGYSFVHCKVTGTGHNAFLARAWMEAARSVYSYCTLTDVVHPEGFSDNRRPQMQKTVYFGEYKNTGPGASVKGRAKFAKQLTDNEAQKFITLDYIEATKWLLPPPKV
ncbi:pectinesterase 1-like [Silene latifolia]|uniref:pectinesterase 1-like n=1 Tax=Silene latifolia TaxID=37657 RepID=UPI003D77D8BC